MVGEKIFASKDNIMTSILLTYPPTFPGERRWLHSFGGPLVLITGLICGWGIPGQNQRQSSILKTFHAGKSPGSSADFPPGRRQAPPTSHLGHLASGCWPCSLQSGPLILPTHCPHCCQNQLLQKGPVHLSRVYPVHTAVPSLTDQHFLLW